MGTQALHREGYEDPAHALYLEGPRKTTALSPMSQRHMRVENERW